MRYTYTLITLKAILSFEREELCKLSARGHREANGRRDDEKSDEDDDLINISKYALSRDSKAVQKGGRADEKTDCRSLRG